MGIGSGVPRSSSIALEMSSKRWGAVVLNACSVGITGDKEDCGRDGYLVLEGQVNVSLDYTIVFAGLKAGGELAHFQAEVLSETFEFFDTQSVVTLVNVEVVMVLPECTLLSRAFCGQGSLVGIVVNMWKMEIGEVYQTGIDVGLLDFEGRTTGPVLDSRVIGSRRNRRW